MHANIATQTLRALRRIMRATEIGSRQLAAATGLTPSQLLVLREIDSRDAATPGAIAHALHFSQATITTIVDRLVALNYVQRQRSERDKRQSHLRILPDGVAALADAPDPLSLRDCSRGQRIGKDLKLVLVLLIRCADQPYLLTLSPFYTGKYNISVI